MVTRSVSNTIYKVSGTVSTAIELGRGGSLSNVLVQGSGADRTSHAITHGIESENVATGGTTAEGSVTNTEVQNTGYGFVDLASFAGTDYSTGNGIGFYWSGSSGVSEAKNAKIISNNDNNFGIFLENVTNSTFSGDLVADNEGATVSNGGNSTGIALWSGDTNNTFGRMVANANPGYGLEIYGSSAGNKISAFYGDGSGSVGGSNPGISIGGGANNNEIVDATVKNYTVGLRQGEDVNPSPYGNKVDTFYGTSLAYPCLDMDRGAYNNTDGGLGGVLCVNTGDASPYLGTIFIANRANQTGCKNHGTNCVEPYGNQVRGLYELGLSTSRTNGLHDARRTYEPAYAVYFGPSTGTESFSGASANKVSGYASSYSTGPYHDASCATTPTSGPCGNMTSISHP